MADASERFEGLPYMGKDRNDRSRSKHQHWVPQFYLRYFATPDSRGTKSPQVWIFSKHDEDGDEQLTHVRNVCGKRYLYTPIDTDGQRKWDLDDRLGDAETLLAEIWRELADGYVSLDDDSIRKGLSLFVALMHLRNPEVREEVEQIHGRIVALYEAAPRGADGTPDVKEVEINGQVHEMDTSGWHGYRSWGRDDHDRFFAHIVQSETLHIAKMLLSKRWSVVCSDKDAFITSDKPVSLHHLEREKFGFRTPGVMVTFPLGPKRMLVMDDMHHEPANQYYPLKDANAGSFNLTTWRNGSRFMITGRPISEVLVEIDSLTPRSPA
jgi:hypothetical protein